VASSGAAGLIQDPSTDASRRLYGALKLEDERRFADWARRARRRAVIGRIFNVSGPYIDPAAGYALASFVVDALAGRPVEVRADRPVERSYVALSELISVALGALTEAPEGVVSFETAGEQVVEMGDLAALVAQVVGGATGVRRPTFATNPCQRYVGEGEIYQRLRRRLGVDQVPLAEQVRETARYLGGGGPAPSGSAERLHEWTHAR
jgi:nucleoside-diphosphate-sugar epimerase